MIILGLTGSIAMGKSFAAAIFRRFHIPVFDADRAVHQLLERNGAAVAKVAALFPEAYENGAINRKLLGRSIFNNHKALKDLEHILHPLVRKAERQFIKQARRQKKPLVLLEIPLLFETHAEQRCDAVIITTASLFMQQKRALKRPGMTKEKLAAILKHQMRDIHKRHKADHVVYTGIGRAVTTRKIKEIIQKCVK